MHAPYFNNANHSTVHPDKRMDAMIDSWEYDIIGQT
jgi:hypothetical protein